MDDWRAGALSNVGPRTTHGATRMLKEAAYRSASPELRNISAPCTPLVSYLDDDFGS